MKLWYWSAKCFSFLKLKTHFNSSSGPFNQYETRPRHLNPGLKRLHSQWMNDSRKGIREKARVPTFGSYSVSHSLARPVRGNPLVTCELSSTCLYLSSPLRNLCPVLFSDLRILGRVVLRKFFSHFSLGCLPDPNELLAGETFLIAQESLVRLWRKWDLCQMQWSDVSMPPHVCHESSMRIKSQSFPTHVFPISHIKICKKKIMPLQFEEKLQTWQPQSNFSHIFGCKKGWNHSSLRWVKFNRNEAATSIRYMYVYIIKVSSGSRMITLDFSVGKILDLWALYSGHWSHRLVSLSNWLSERMNEAKKSWVRIGCEISNSFSPRVC